MDKSSTKSKIFSIISIICIVIGLLCWIPTFTHKEGPVTNPIWIYSFPLGIIAVIFGVLNKKIILTILGAFVTTSFFTFMFFGYLIEYIKTIL